MNVNKSPLPSAKRKKKSSISIDLKEMFCGTSVKFRNMHGANKFYKQNHTKRFAKIAKKIWFDTWLGFKLPNPEDVKLYNAEIRTQSNRILTLLKDEDGIVTTPSGIKLTTQGVNPEEFVEQYFNLIYADKLLGRNPDLTSAQKRDDRFRNICGAYWLSFLENINYEGSWETSYSNIKPDDVVVDIGGGYGFFALVALKQGAKRVYVFEPNDAVRAILIKNRDLNGYTKEQMPIYKNALGAHHVEKAILYARPDRLCSGVIRALDIDKNFCITHVEQITKVITFDEFYRRIDTNGEDLKIDFIKISTNGNECDVVKGMAYFLTYTEQRPDIVTTIFNTPDDEQNFKSALLNISNDYAFSKRMAKLHAYINPL